MSRLITYGAEDDVTYRGDSHLSRRSWRIGIATAAVVVSGVVAAGPAGGTPPTPASGWQATPQTANYSVTLVTGDVVHVTPGDGRSAVTVTPAPRTNGARPSFWVSQHGQDLTVLPSDVAALVPTRLDPALFDVTSLTAQGDGDAQSSTIPLIATYDGTPRALPATTATRALPSVHAAAMRVTKASAAKLGIGATLPAGVRKLWLDARVHVDLDTNLTQIGAPQAWDAGYNGKGVKVAVLDSGIDASHPDLAGAVAASQNFTDTADATDHFGHGTHVASIIAGRGAASDGARRGVAYGATLLNGKVLGDDGYGYASSIIAGMDWASTTQHADIVNLSLGFPPGTTEGNPVTAAVDRLTAANHTLFVIAAGNNTCGTCIASPADAASALTVGAVDSHDQLADFSSRGPVPGTDAVKPDITAPGVDIVAARAAGTSLGTPVGDNYTTLSGTSMAAPHVAGAAADLLQARGAMDPTNLKAALMDTAASTAGVPIYSQGAGRLDIGAALTTPVSATPGVVDFGRFSWPYPTAAPSKTITYHNRADHPITLALSSDLPAAHLSTATLSIPAGGTATADVSVDTSVGAAGTFAGTITAAVAGGPTVHTTVGFGKAPEMHDVHVNAIARDGRAAVGGFRVIDVHDGSVAATRYWPGAAAEPCTTASWAESNCIRVPVGTYSIMGFVFTMPPDQPSTDQGVRNTLNTTLVGNPQVTISKDTTLTFDARTAREVSVATPGHDDAHANLGGAAQIGYSRTPQNGAAEIDQIVNSPGDQLEERLFMQPTPPVTIGQLDAYTRWRLEAPAITLRSSGIQLDPEYYDPVWFSEVSSQYPRLDGTARLRVVDAGTATAPELAGRDLHGALAVVRRSDTIPVGDQSNNAAAAGARMVAIYNDGPGVDAAPGKTGIKLQVPTVRLPHDEGQALLARPGRTVTAAGIRTSPYQYDLVYREHGRIPTNLHYTARLNQLAAVTRHFNGEAGNDLSYGEAAYAFLPGAAFASTTIYPLTGAPRTRIDYHVGDPDVRWAYGVETPEPRYNNLWPHSDFASMELNTAATTTYRSGQRTSDYWLNGPIAPGLSPVQPLQRSGDVMRVHMAGFIDASGNYADAYTSQFEHGLNTDFHLYAGDQLVAQTKFLAAGTMAVPA
ncbi:MAG TPA: S8 family serine peptidase, partial [Jatrophihabitantaceae bacterium]